MAKLRPLVHAAGWASVTAPRSRQWGDLHAIVHTTATRRVLLRTGFAPQRVHVVPHGIPVVECAKPAVTDPVARERWGIPPDVKLSLIFGFVLRHKGSLTAIEAFERLPAEHHLLIAGAAHPETEDRTEEAIAARVGLSPDLAQRVHRIGHVREEDIAALHSAADLCLFPYHATPRLSSSAALTWAIAAGRPVVASRIPAFEGLAQKAQCVEFVMPESPADLAAAVARVGADEALRRRLGARALEYAAGRSWHVAAERHAEVYWQAAERVVDPQFARRLRHAGGRRVARAAHRLQQGRQTGDVCKVRLGAGISATLVLGNDREDPIVQRLQERGRYEDRVRELMLDLVQPEWRVVDVGAHLGTFALAAAAAGATVLAVEPNRRNVELLRRSVELNAADVLVAEAAAVERPQAVRFTPHGAYGHVALAREPRPGLPLEEVRGVALDDLAQEHGWERVDLMKLDVEGGEPAALAGAVRLLDALPAPVVLVEANAHMLNLFGKTPADVLSPLAERGYELFLIDRAHARRLVPVAAGDLQPECVSDYLACRSAPLQLHNWRMVRPFTRRELLDRLEKEARSPHWELRRHVARSLSCGPDRLMSDPSVRDLVARLRRDHRSEVRRALS